MAGSRWLRRKVRRNRRPPGKTCDIDTATVRAIFENGEPEQVIDFDAAKAPFQHNGKPGSILDVLLGHGMSLEHACGGSCACTTCHVIVKRGVDQLSDASEQEEDLLDKAPGLAATSRLACQAIVEDPFAEIIVIVPRFTINRVSESAHAIPFQIQRARCGGWTGVPANQPRLPSRRMSGQSQ